MNKEQLKKDEEKKYNQKLDTQKEEVTVFQEKKDDPDFIRKWLYRIKDAFRGPIVEADSEKTEAELAEKMRQELKIVEKVVIRNGVDFSRCQIKRFIDATKKEFESFGLYLSDHNLNTGEIFKDKLTEDETIGLTIAKMLRKIFKEARVISLFDEYNTDMPDSETIIGAPTEFMMEGKIKKLDEKSNNILPRQIEISEEKKEIFKKSNIELMRDKQIIRPEDKEGKDYLLISESSKIKDAEQLESLLRKKGLAQEKNGKLFFINDAAENPAYREIELRDRNGHWRCEALDASAYLKPENLEIAHLVILPDTFKEQQDKVWEILRVLGIQPDNYHNIFFDSYLIPEKVQAEMPNQIKKITEDITKNAFNKDHFRNNPEAREYAIKRRIFMAIKEIRPDIMELRAEEVRDEIKKEIEVYL